MKTWDAKYGYSKTSLQGLGYKEVIEYLDGKISYEEMIEKVKQESRHYAKRQMTWFSHMDYVEWIDGKEDMVEIIANNFQKRWFLQMKIKDTTKQNILYIIIACIIVGATFFIFYFIKMFRKPTEYIIVRNDRITKYENVNALVIREEELVNTNSFSGERKIVAQDATKIAKGGVIASFIEQENEIIKKDIDKIDEQIQTLISEDTSDYSQDFKTIDKELGQKVYDIYGIENEYTALVTLKNSIEEDLYSKIKSIGKSAPSNSELKELVNERVSYEDSKYSSKKDLKSTKSGMVSYRVDGYEDVFTPADFSKITPEELKKVPFVIDQQIPIDSQKIKIVNNFVVYLAIMTDSEEGKNLHLNDTIRISFDGSFSNYSKATVEYIIDEEDTRVVIVKTEDNTENLSKYRKVNLDIIWWNYEGMKVPNESVYQKAIINEATGEVYATVDAIKVLGTTGYQKEVYIKIEKATSDFSIIKNYDDEELLEMGIPEGIVDDRNKLNLYDRVVVN